MRRKCKKNGKEKKNICKKEIKGERRKRERENELSWAEPILGWAPV
jgi:hypothetical protein